LEERETWPRDSPLCRRGQPSNLPTRRRRRRCPSRGFVSGLTLLCFVFQPGSGQLLARRFQCAAHDRVTLAISSASTPMDNKSSLRVALLCVMARILFVSATLPHRRLAGPARPLFRMGLASVSIWDQTPGEMRSSTLRHQEQCSTGIALSLPGRRIFTVRWTFRWRNQSMSWMTTPLMRTVRSGYRAMRCPAHSTILRNGLRAGPLSLGTRGLTLHMSNPTTRGILSLRKSLRQAKLLDHRNDPVTRMDVGLRRRFRFPLLCWRAWLGRR